MRLYIYRPRKNTEYITQKQMFVVSSLFGCYGYQLTVMQPASQWMIYYGCYGYHLRSSPRNNMERWLRLFLLDNLIYRCPIRHLANQSEKSIPHAEE